MSGVPVRRSRCGFGRCCACNFYLRSFSLPVDVVIFVVAVVVAAVGLFYDTAVSILFVIILSAFPPFGIESKGSFTSAFMSLYNEVIVVVFSYL